MAASAARDDKHRGPWWNEFTGESERPARSRAWEEAVLRKAPTPPRRIVPLSRALNASTVKVLVDAHAAAAETLRIGRAALAAVPAPEAVAATPAVPVRSRRARAAYPQGFISEGVRMLVSRDVDEAERYWQDCQASRPDEAEGWLGLAAVALARRRMERAAAYLVTGRGLDPGFPIDRLVGDATDDPADLYDLAAALVGLRHRAAYECAERVLDECLAHHNADATLLARAQKVRLTVREALEQRAARDDVRQGEVRQPILLFLVCLLTAVGILYTLVQPLPSSATRHAALPPASGPAVALAAIPNR
jgi:hypothetical protein